MDSIIKEFLKKQEKRKGLEILFACESGSRAWGFSSPNSDWDIRFIYKYPRDKYLGIQDFKDAYDIQISAMELDFGGWDVKKAAGLLKNYNGALVEWLHSPVIYIDSRPAEVLRELAPKYFNAKAALSHYLNLAKGINKRYIEGQDQFSIKKLLYIIRPLASAEYIINFNKQPPTLFEETLLHIDEPKDVINDIWSLVKRKRKSKELDFMRANEAGLLLAWIKDKFNKVEKKAHEADVPQIDIDPLNQWVVDVINNVL